METSFDTINWLLSLLLFSPFVRVLSCLTVLRLGLGAGGSGFGIVIAVISLATALSCPWPGPQPRYASKEGAPTIELGTNAAVIESRTSKPVMEKLSKATAMSKDGQITTALVLSELKTGLELGIALVIPLIVIDLLAVHLLQLLNITQISASLVVAPLKLALFTIIGGWELLIEKLLLGFATGGAN